MGAEISPDPSRTALTTPNSGLNIQRQISAITTVGTMYGKSSSPRKTLMPRTSAT